MCGEYGDLRQIVCLLLVIRSSAIPPNFLEVIYLRGVLMIKVAKRYTLFLYDFFFEKFNLVIQKNYPVFGKQFPKYSPNLVNKIVACAS